jgi:hypothetical protein
VRSTRVWERACGLQRTVVEDVAFDYAAQAVVVSVRPNAELIARRLEDADRGDARRTNGRVDLGSFLNDVWLPSGHTCESSRWQQSLAARRRHPSSAGQAAVVMVSFVRVGRGELVVRSDSARHASMRATIRSQRLVVVRIGVFLLVDLDHPGCQ